MPICQHCKQKWTWLESMKKIFRMTCPYCGEKQYQSAQSKKIASFIYVIPMLIVFIMNSLFSLSIGVGLMFLLLILALFFSIIPFYLKLSNEEEFWF